ncbi:MAG: hypothetical protein OXB97_01325 [Rhodospirillales bacterium]|nr:hypothetical protein [Rhodospirillales bacterium]
MKRATLVERAERVAAAQVWCRRHGEAEAVRRLVRRYAISAVQARRYVRAGQDGELTLARAEAREPLTVRLPQSLVARLRTRARRTGQGVGGLVALALTRFLAGERPDE